MFGFELIYVYVLDGGPYHNEAGCMLIGFGFNELLVKNEIVQVFCFVSNELNFASG